MGVSPSATSTQLAYDDTVTLAALGAQIDPVEGGSANDYDYVAGDPVNQFDLSGECVFGELRDYAWRPGGERSSVR